MADSIGLLVVHGIGNQRPGELGAAMAMRLSDTDTSFTENEVKSSSIKLSNTRKEKLKHDLDVFKIKVNGVPVVIHEANWAPLSHPDNPPKVRESSKIIILEFYRTVGAAWQSINPFAKSAGKSKSDRLNSMYVWLIFAAILAIPLIGHLAIPGLGKTLSFVAVVFFITFMFYSAYKAFHGWNLERKKATKQTWKSIFVHLPIVVITGFYRPLIYFFGAEMLLFLSIPVLLSYPVNLLGWLILFPFRGVGWLFSRLRLRFIRNWVHRIGWVMIVLPIHSFLQVVKATGNVYSILFTEKGANVMISAFLWLIGIYFASLLLIIICEILLIIPFVPFLLDAEAPDSSFIYILGGLIIYIVIILPLYLFLVKVSLPAIDLILDISNYHLSSDEERQQYYRRMNHGVVTLLKSGCKEIHILAHSLGSIIIYDWLKSIKPNSYPLAVLHTIGSPLNKFWYIDHTQERRLSDREGLKNRISCSWVNYWALTDPVSGKLKHYNAPGLPITNKRLQRLGLYILSHSRYWRNRVVIDEIRDKIRKSPLSPPFVKGVTYS